MSDLLGKWLVCPGEVIQTEALRFLFAVEWALVFRFTTYKDIYGQDAMEFRPERWEDPALTDIRWAYLHFHGGLGLCLQWEVAVNHRSEGKVLFFGK